MNCSSSSVSKSEFFHRLLIPLPHSHTDWLPNTLHFLHLVVLFPQDLRSEDLHLGRPFPASLTSSAALQECSLPSGVFLASVVGADLAFHRCVNVILRTLSTLFWGDKFSHWPAAYLPSTGNASIKHHAQLVFLSFLFFSFLNSAPGNQTSSLSHLSCSHITLQQWEILSMSC